MENVKACRICLTTNTKLYKMCKYHLKNVYENLTGLTVSNADYLQQVCSFCGTMLAKFNNFKEKCLQSQLVFEMFVKDHVLVSSSQIEIIKQTYNLSLPYLIENLQNHDILPLTNIETNFVNTDFAIIPHIKDEDLVKTESCDVDEIAQINFIENGIANNCSDLDQYHQCDSDEEPLSKKIKKKQKKTKMKQRKSSKLKKIVNIDIKSEELLTVESNIPINNEDVPNDDNFKITKQDFPAIDDHFPINEQNVPENDNKFPGDQNFPANDFNQTVELESNHELVILSEQEQMNEILSRKTSDNYLNSVYKCEHCYKGFMTDTTYKNHMARHDPSCGAIVCPICATRWPDARSLRAHTLIAHERRYTCRACGHASKSRHKAAEHARWHAGATFPCACGRRFARSTTYLTHVRRAHGTHACPLCRDTFIGELGLSMHKKKAHRDKSDPEVFECERCKKHFKTSAALERHCDVTGRECQDTLHVCLQCGDHFSSDLLLKQHTDMHLKTDSARTCSQCSRTFAHERSLAAHAQRAHSRAQTQSRHQVCEVCGYKCMSASSLVNHQRVHSGEKPHACPHCSKRFSVAQRLQIHVRTHTGERPFQCPRCPKAFKHKAALNRHDRVHTGVKPYSCPQCGKRFSQSNSMKQHCAGVHMKTAIYATRNKQTF